MSKDTEIVSTANTPMVESLGLADRVWGLASGELTPNGKPMRAAEIHRLLIKEGHKLSYKSVTSWVNKQRDKVKEDVRGILTEHLRNKLPGDLDALELVEEVSLENAKKSIKFITHEVSVNEQVHKHFTETWLLEIVDAMGNEKMLRGLVTQIVRQVGDWITERIDWMKTQRDERKVALTAIDMKLRYAAQLHGAGSGNILIYGQGEGPADPASSEKAQDKEPQKQERKKGGENVVTFAPR